MNMQIYGLLKNFRHFLNDIILLKKNPVIVPTSPQYGVARAQSSTTINCHAQKVRIRSPITVWTKKIKKLLSS